MRRLHWASSGLFVSVLLPFVVPVAIEHLLPSVRIARRTTYGFMMGVYVAALAVFVFWLLRCPRCKQRLWRVHLNAEFGKLDSQEATCPRCGLDLKALLK